MLASELLSSFPLRRQHGTAPIHQAPDISDVTTNSKTVSKNAVFVAIKTPIRDGHYGVAEAFDNGCRLFIVEHGVLLPASATVLIAESTTALLGDIAAKCFGYPARHLTVFGITGTHGKTSTALLTAAMLRRCGKKVGTITTDGIDDGNCRTYTTTKAPDAADIQRALHRFHTCGVEYAVLEFSAYMLTQQAENSIPFTALLLTNLSPAHIGEGIHRTWNDYLAAKAFLFRHESPFICLPDTVTEILPQHKNIRFGKTGDLTVNRVTFCEKNDKAGMCFQMTYANKTIDVFHPVPTDFAVDNALGATLLCLIAGLALDEIGQLLADCVPCGRMECLWRAAGKQIYFDTAYEAGALHRTLSFLRRITKGRLTVLLGTVGGRAATRRALLGKTALHGADFVFFTADDADQEDVKHIFADLTQDIDDTSRCRLIEDRREALFYAVSKLRCGDTLLVLGKTEPTQLICGKRVPFCDKNVLYEVLGEH